MRALAAALLAALALACHPLWPDAELARRGELLVLVGGLALTAPWWFPARPGRSVVPLAGLAGWFLLRSFGSEPLSFGIERAAYLGALTVLVVLGRVRPAQDWLRAALPAGAAVATLGLLQASGWAADLAAALSKGDAAAWLTAGTAAEPTSSLGNRNVAAEFVAVVAAGAAALAAREARPRLPLAVFAVCGAYLLVNGSRSGLLAVPLALVLILADRRVARARRGLLVAAVLAALGVGGLVRLARPTADAAVAAATSAEITPSTVEVRLELWKACWKLVREHPLLGQGSGQFAVQYQRARSQREIELSTFGAQGARSSRAAPRVAHNDLLEIAVETGAVGLALAVAAALGFWVAAWRCGPLAAAPLLAFATTAMVRAPLWNAPAAVLAALIAGAALGPTAHSRAPRLLAIALALGGALAVVLGLSPWAAQTEAARYLAARDHDASAARAALDRALAWCDDDPHLHALRLQERAAAGGNAGGDLDSDLAALGRTAPHDVGYLMLRAETLHRLGRTREALALLEHLLDLDPRDPSALLLLAAIQTQTGQIAAAIATLEHDPHPRLRAVLADTFTALATAAEGYRADLAGAGRTEAAEQMALGALALRSEGWFVRGLDHLELDPVAAKADADALKETMASAEVVNDGRALVLYALLALANGDRKTALGFGAVARQRGATFTAGQRRLLEPWLTKLSGAPEWRAVLAPR